MIVKIALESNQSTQWIGIFMDSERAVTVNYPISPAIEEAKINPTEARASTSRN